MAKKSISTHPNSKRVTIFRIGSFLSRAQGAQADEYFSGSKMSIGSFFESKDSIQIGSGLNFKEQELLLPLIIDTPVEDREFRKKVREFFQEIDTQVPHNTGVTLEIGLESDNDKPVSKDNMPIEIMDYIRYRHAKAHPEVAESKDAAAGNVLIKYYIFDKDAVQGKASKRNKEKDQAYAEYLKIKNDNEQVEQILALMGVDIREFLALREADREEAKVEKLRELAETKSAEFIAAQKEGDLEIRAAIKSMVQTGILKQIGKRYLDAETKDPIGNDLEEAILFMKDEVNSGTLIALKARLQEAQRTPVNAETRKTVL